MLSHGISAWSATWSVHDQLREQCMISHVNSACSVTWSGPAELRQVSWGLQVSNKTICYCFIVIWYISFNIFGKWRICQVFLVQDPGGGLEWLWCAVGATCEILEFGAHSWDQALWIQYSDASGFLGDSGVKNMPASVTRVWSLIQKDSTCSGATKPMSHNYWAYALESKSQNQATAMRSPSTD